MVLWNKDRMHKDIMKQCYQIDEDSCKQWYYEAKIM